MMAFNRNRPADSKSPEGARQGETSGHMRWVLGASLFLIVAAFVANTDSRRCTQRISSHSIKIVAGNANRLQRPRHSTRFT